MLLKESPFCALLWLATLAVVAPLDGVAHGRHGCGLLRRLFTVFVVSTIIKCLQNAVGRKGLGILYAELSSSPSWSMNIFLIAALLPFFARSDPAPPILAAETDNNQGAPSRVDHQRIMR